MTPEPRKEQAMSGIHDKIAAAISPKLTTLHCHHCGAQRSCTEADISRYLATGWPLCCGYAMWLKESDK